MANDFGTPIIKNVPSRTLARRSLDTIFDELMSGPVDTIRFIDIAKMWPVAPRFAESLWETIKSEARDEFESGHSASKAMTPTQFPELLGPLPSTSESENRS